jgi:hypothetical protein
MDQAGRGFSASPTLTQNQHGHVGLRQQGSLRAELSHDWADTYEDRVVAQRFYVVTGDINFSRFMRLGKITLNGHFKLAVIERPD